MSFVSNLFGGKARREAAAEAANARAQARQEQAVAGTRQLAALNTADSQTGLSRRRPRGRRLFADAGPQKDTLS